ncbi:trypsin-like serine peptidase [Pseudochelatococcus lubricantis]|uniref:trypsin-like serine peptidase n=1 Tax=Pseudochelatococcus lubricantis TaxID=1538102 RepID=UPI0035E96812
MADGDDQSFDPAVYLAGWTKLPLDDFKACYKSTYPRDSARSWEELVAGGGASMIRAACLEAASFGFLDRLADVIGKWEADAGRDAAEIATMLPLTSGGGIMQAIINRATGFLDPKSLLAVYHAYDACAMVVGPQGFRGTAFLVRPDMVLTAAHVVLDCAVKDDARTWADHIFEDLIFSFRPRDGTSTTNRVQVRAAAKDAMVAFSKPWGQWPNLLNLSLASPPEPTLDYALIRLAQRVEHVKPVVVDPPAGVEAQRRCWTTGYPGGNAGVVDIDVVVNANAGGGRWLHKANAVQGMSGACCINDLGKLAGIHEGCVNLPVGGKNEPFNRGISIAAIRNHQKSPPGRDPMLSRVVVQGIEFEDAEMVGELYRAGQRLADPAFAANWDSAVRAVLGGADPSLTASLPAFHPWFSRDRFEDWIRRSAPRERLCFVSGERGAGASFCKQILKARLDPSGIDYIEINPTQVAAFSPREAIPAAAAATPSPSRTSAADFRYNDANDLIAQLRGGGQYIAGPRTIAIDFGSEGGPDRLIGTSWQEFILRLLSEEAVRLVLIGLTRDEQSVLHDILLDNPATEDILAVPIQLAHVTADEFEIYAGALADARGMRLKTADLRKRIEPILGPHPYEPPVNAALRTAFFALAAITLEAELES